jgi:hypothetical protein
MRPARYLAYGLVLSLSASGAEAVVHVVVVGGKKVITNDGIGEAAAGGERLSGGWSAARVAAPSRFDDLIASAASKHALDPRLLKSVMLFESGFNPKAVSRKGARGLMQLMPKTAAQQISTTATSRRRWPPTTRERLPSSATAVCLLTKRLGAT